MSACSRFRKMFSEADIELRDMYLLEPFQISYLPGWVPEDDFACVIEQNPAIAVFLEKKYPPIAKFIKRIREEHPSAAGREDSDSCEDRLIWTIADMLVYNSCPAVYDSLEFHNWDFGEVTSITPLDNRVVIDAGAGTGRVALEAAEYAAVVYAVEPVARLREFIREKASAISNLYTVDGFLHRLPFPDSFADVLITSHALGWELPQELQEFQRVVRSGGCIIHCPGTSAGDGSSEIHDALVSWGYRYEVYSEADGDKRKYWKFLTDSCPIRESEI